MSEVKRFDFYGDFERETHEAGDYVLHSDYAAVLAQKEALEKERDEVIQKNHEFNIACETMAGLVDTACALGVASEKDLAKARLLIARAFPISSITPQWLSDAADFLREAPHEAK